MFLLRIVLESPLASGSGLSRPGVADREAVFDDCGLPWLPARRLRGLLRDAYGEMHSMLGSAVSGLTDQDELFGKSGTRTGKIDVRNGYLSDYRALREWACDFTAGEAGEARRAAISDFYSTVRRQTAMDRLLGSPKKETLRATRTLRPGLSFEAEIQFADGQNAASGMALAAAALREMGSSRWRGLGRVRCELLERRENGADFNWTQIALEALGSDSFEPRLPASPSSTEAKEDEPGSIMQGSLSYELRFEEPAVFPIIAGDPNTVNTADYVPGSSIHGWFANAHGRFDSEEFQNVFTSGKVQFLNVYPVVKAARGCLLPHSVRRRKEEENQFVDLSAAGVDEKDTRRARLWHRPEDLPARLFSTTTPSTTIHYHHARAKGDFERALGAEEAQRLGLRRQDAGAFFQYESLLPEQTFQSEIRGSADVLEVIRNLAPGGTRLRLGRSKGAQYGAQATIRWIEPCAKTKPVGGPSRSFRVVARSAVMGYNDHGMPVPCFPLAELAEELKCTLTPQLEFARSSWEGGYLRHLQTPRSQHPGWAAGSVLVLQADRELAAAELAQAASRPYGLRREHGYGEVDLDFGGVTGTINLADARETRHAKAAIEKPARDLAIGIYARAVFSEAKLIAGQMVRARMRGRLPKRALVHRLMGMLASQSEEEFQRSLTMLREPAARQLEGCYLMKEGNLLPADTELGGFLKRPRGRLGETISFAVWKRDPWSTVFPESPPVPISVGYEFLREFLAVLANETRRQKK